MSRPRVLPQNRCWKLLWQLFTYHRTANNQQKPSLKAVVMSNFHLISKLFFTKVSQIHPLGTTRHETTTKVLNWHVYKKTSASSLPCLILAPKPFFLLCYVSFRLTSAFMNSRFSRWIQFPSAEQIFCNQALPAEQASDLTPSIDCSVIHLPSRVPECVSHFVLSIWTRSVSKSLYSKKCFELTELHWQKHWLAWRRATRHVDSSCFTLPCSDTFPSSSQ